ncbi:ROK family transcriptional regulator [Nocardia rhamnosiphila]|uniref:ROK family transcriptional regulator n=1 Tax=Nocardia rhamnosiphila TaxID=426716 RepID=UPI0033FC4675
MADGSAGSVLRAVLELGPAPRSAIARHAAISPATLTWQARALIAAGLLVELPETTASAGLGRPYSPLALNAAGNIVVGVHIAAGHSTVAVVDIAGTVLRSRRFPHPGPEPEDILALAAAQVCRIRDECTERIVGLGVATGGWVDTEAGAVVHHSLLGWRDVPVRDRLAGATGLPTALDNHTRALMYAEQLYGTIRAAPSSIMLFVGNVIDVAFAVHGRVHYGPRSAAGSLARWLGGTRTGPLAPAELAELADHALLRAARASIGEFAGFPDLLDHGAEPAVQELFRARAGTLGGVLAALIDLLDPAAVVISDRAYTRVPGVRQAYLDTVADQAAAGVDPGRLIAGSTFQGRVLETAAAAVALQRLFDRPLAAGAV